MVVCRCVFLHMGCMSCLASWPACRWTPWSRRASKQHLPSRLTRCPACPCLAPCTRHSVLPLLAGHPDTTFVFYSFFPPFYRVLLPQTPSLHTTHNRARRSTRRPPSILQLPPTTPIRVRRRRRRRATSHRPHHVQQRALARRPSFDIHPLHLRLATALRLLARRPAHLPRCQIPRSLSRCSPHIYYLGAWLRTCGNDGC